VLVSGIRHIEEYDRLTGHWCQVKSAGEDRVLAVALKPGDGRLFRVKG
jgi:hypothetical protein